MHMYSDLAPWFHLLTHPSDYGAEAACYTRVIEQVSGGRARTLLELGSGGGNNASHMKARFECTLTDLSAEMLALSRTLNPECEHIQGDMRGLRLGRAFDAVLVHDAVMYMTTQDDLAAAVETAAVHVRPGGVALFVPDAVRETFSPGVQRGGHDGPDGRSLRYLERTHAPDPDGTSFEVDFAIMLREPGEQVRVVHDHHELGLFPRETWLRLIAEAGLALVDPPPGDPHDEEHEVFVGRRPSA
jgi:SAM-dependent methyltransferase